MLRRLSSKFYRVLLFAVLPLAVMASMSLASARQFIHVPDVWSPGTIVIKLSEHKLYFVLTKKSAIGYPVAVPRKGREWSGRATVSGKLTDPDWVPPDAVREDHPDLPPYVPHGSPMNPLGARAILLDRGQVAIHGSSAKTRRSIGTAASYGCIRMLNEDVIDLYGRVSIGTPVLTMR